MRIPLSVPLSLSAALLLGGCESLQRTDSLFGLITPYRIDIQQGNIVAPETFTKLKTGMTRTEVRTLLGTPLLTDVFHANRWDYYFRNEKRGQLQEQIVQLTSLNQTVSRRAEELTNALTISSKATGAISRAKVELTGVSPMKRASRRSRSSDASSSAFGSR